MNVLIIRRLFTTSVLLAIFLVGCATSPIPELSQPQSSGLGIDVTLKAPIAIFSRKADQVFFARIDGDDGLLQQTFVRSNYVKDGRAFFLNARPGTYVAVAAFFSSGGGARGAFTTYFSKELVEQTRIIVRENEVVFMGNYVIAQSAGLEEADAVQTHYKNVIAPGDTTNVFLMGLFANVHYRGTLIERKNDEQTRNDFIRNAKEDLAGSAWAARLK